MERTIYLAGGCFWGIQGYFDLLQGVLSTCVGYANSVIPNPSYEMVCSGITGATEAIEIVYDDSIIALDSGVAGNKNLINTESFVPDCLLSRFFSIIDPTALNYQANDRGTQYRSGIYVINTDEIEKILNFMQKYITPQYAQKLVTEVLVLQNFYKAESYHQKYLEKNPRGYCHIDISRATKALC